MLVPYRCWADVDLAALRENLAWLRHRVGAGVRILTVVKADAYGHGLKPIAALLMQSGTDVFGVANLGEAQTIRAVGAGWPILMLGACLPQEVSLAVRDQVMPTLSSLEEAQQFSSAALRQKVVVRAHLKVDTGMGRLGVGVTEAEELAVRLHALPGLQLEGLFTHYAAAEDDPEFTAAQAAQFSRLVERLHARGVRLPTIHANNSAALLHAPSTLFNLVRPGLLVYGVSPPGPRRPAAAWPDHLKPALSWHCRVSLVKRVARGTSLSYGRSFVAPRAMRVATLTAGYGDGYARAGSNRAWVLIGGRRCRIVGRITMDQMLADVTRVPAVKPGDPVVLIGRQGEDQITAADLAAWGDTVPWEVLTNISYRVPRIYRGAQAA